MSKVSVNEFKLWSKWYLTWMRPTKTTASTKNPKIVHWRYDTHQNQLGSERYNTHININPLKSIFLKPAWTDDTLGICRYSVGECYEESPTPFHSLPKICLPRTRSPHILEGSRSFLRPTCGQIEHMEKHRWQNFQTLSKKQYGT